MKHRINITGLLVPNDYKWYYEYFGEDCTCPEDIKKVLDAFKPGDEIEVYINSPGGAVDVGSEIYTMLRKQQDSVKIYITGKACSAASVIAMAAYCEMSPTSLMMVHCASSSAAGNHNKMEQMAETLKTVDKSISMAYVQKTGMTEKEALEMMEHETWMTAEQAKERGLVDGIMFDNKEEFPIVAGPLFTLPNEEKLKKVKMMLEKAKEHVDNGPTAFLIQTKFNYLKLEGEKR